VRRRLGRLGGVPVEHRHEGRPGERQRAGDQLVEHHAEAVEVGPLVHLVAQRLLRRHVVGRAQKRAGASQPRLAHHQLGDAEVEQLHLVAAARQRDQEDVGRLQVAVNDPGRVRRAEPGRDLKDQIDRRRLRERSSLDARVQRLPLQPLHRQVDRAVRRDAEVLDVDDVAVTDGAGSARLAAQPLDRVGIAGQLAAQELDRHPLAGVEVLGLEDVAGPALADGAQQAVAVELSRQRRSGSRRRVAIREQLRAVIGAEGEAGGASPTCWALPHRQSLHARSVCAPRRKKTRPLLATSSAASRRQGGGGRRGDSLQRPALLDSIFRADELFAPTPISLSKQRAAPTQPRDWYLETQYWPDWLAYWPIAADTRPQHPASRVAGGNIRPNRVPPSGSISRRRTARG